MANNLNMTKLIALSLMINITVCQITSMFNYQDMEGNQIYFGPTDNSFTVLTLKRPSNTKIMGLISFHTTYSQSQIKALGVGIWIGIGFGSTTINNSDFVMCSLSNKLTGSCGDYFGVNTDIVRDSLQNVNYLSFSVSDLDNAWTPFKTRIVFEWEKSTNSNEIQDYINLGDIMAGNVSVIAAWGVRFNDGNINNPFGYTELFSADGRGTNQAYIDSITTSVYLYGRAFLTKSLSWILTTLIILIFL